MASLALSVRLLAGVILFLPVSLGAMVVVNGNSNAPITNTPSYTFTTIAGNPGVAGSSDGSGTNATFNGPMAVAVDTNGILYVADTGNDTIRRIDANGTVTTLAGLAGQAGFQDGQGTNAFFNSPEGLAVDTNGLIYVADSSNNIIRRMDSSGNVAIWAGVPLRDFYSYYTNPPFGTTPTSVLTGGVYSGNFDIPSGLSFGSDGRLWVAQKGTNALNSFVSPVSTNGTIGGGVALNYYDSFVTGVAVTKNGRIFYVSNGGQGATNFSHVMEYTIYPYFGLNAVAGSKGGFNGPVGNEDGLGINAELNHPTAIAADAQGDLFFTDSGNNSIRMIDTANGNHVTTLSYANGVSNNTPNTAGNADGSGFFATFNAPEGIAVDAKGVIYIADTGNHTIRKGTPPAQKLNQTLLSSTNLPAKAKVGDTLIYTASYSSGLPPVLSSSDNNVATVSGNTVHPVGTGKVTIFANQLGNVFYMPAITVSMNLTISKGSQMIGNFPPFTNSVHTYGDMPFFVSPMASGTGTMTLTSSNKKVATSQFFPGGYYINIVGAGMTTITASLSGNFNYLAAPPVHQVLTVNKAPQTIGFTTQGTQVVGAKFTLMGTSTSGLALKFTSSNPKVLLISGTNATAVLSGIAKIITTQSGNSNYLPAVPVTNTVSVGPKFSIRPIN